METDKNHIHLLVKSEPRISPLMIVRRLKQETTIRMWITQNAYLRKYYWPEHTLWSDAYFVDYIENFNKEIVAEYIRNQG
jgi:putative transposase